MGIGRPKVCIQTDSKLIAEQVNRRWACRSLQLQPALVDAWAKIRLMEQAGREVIVEHIYREYNRAADGLANRAIEERSSSAWTQV